MKDLAPAVGTSRPVFERRLATQVGRPPKAEALRLRFDRVKALVADTDWPLAQIAGRTGLRSMRRFPAAGPVALAGQLRMASSRSLK